MITGQGYDYKKGKSVNAVNAESNGLYPLSFISNELGLEPETIKKHFKPKEWHHTSIAYNRTYYYDFQYIESSLTDDILADNTKIKADKKVEKHFDNCFVQYRTKEQGSYVIKTIDNAKVNLKSSTAKVYIPVPNTDQFVIEEMRLGSKDFILLTEHDKAEIDQALKPLLDKEFYKAVYLDGKNYYGIMLNDAGEYSQYRNSIKYQQITEQELKHHIYSSGSVDECLGIIDELNNKECSMTNKSEFVIATDNIRNTTMSLKRNGMRLQQYPTMSSLVGIEDPKWEENKIVPIKRLKNVLYSEGYFARAGRFFNNNFDKAPKNIHMGRKEKIKKMMSIVSLKSGFGNLQLNDEWVDKLSSAFEDIKIKDLSLQSKAKQEFFENLKYSGFVSALKESCNKGDKVEDMHYWNIEKNIFDLCIQNNMGTFKLNSDDTAKLHKVIFDDDDVVEYTKRLDKKRKSNNRQRMR